MKKVMLISVVSISLFTNNSFSQIFKGGAGNGSIITNLQNSSSLYYGGSANGFNHSLFTNTLNIYTGSNGNGFDASTILNSTSLFVGGNGNGYAQSTSSNAQSIFNGGESDGFVLVNSTNIVGFYIGGNGNGFNSSETSNLNNLFSGSSGDGFDMNPYTNTPFLYVGGTGNGFSTNQGSNSNHLFRGGNGNGFVYNETISSFGFYSGGSGQGQISTGFSNAGTLFEGGSAQGFNTAFYSTENALPVEWTYFKATKINETDVLLEWGVFEINNDYFELYKSEGTIGDFRQIGTIDGVGTSSDEMRYDYLDKNTFSGISYYQIKQVDYDGNYDYSKIIAVYNDVQDINNISFYPNPVRDYLNVNMNGNKDCKVELQNIQGITVYRNKITNEDHFVIDTRDFTPGIYVLRISFYHTNFTSRIIIY